MQQTIKIREQQRMSPNRIIKPRRLRRGDTIGIVAPASPFDPDELERGRSVLHALGFQTRLADGLMARKGYLAGEDDHRLAQLHKMLSDPQVHAVMCARGGYGTLRLLNAIDYGLVRASEKPFIGFSDITALHQAFYWKSGIVTFHGPLVTTFAEADEITCRTFVSAVTDPAPCRIRADRARIVVSGKAEGVVTGGNLTVLSHLVGTPYHPVFKDCIVVIEDIGEKPYRIDRMFTQMKMAGCFEGVAGFVFGSFHKCGPRTELFELFKTCFNDLNVPIAAGFGTGHNGRNTTLPFGIVAHLDAVKGELTYLENAISE
jgi:muramoyltetrapeptide carboxypeptidase